MVDSPVAPPARPQIGSGLRLAIDIGPLAIFFLVNFLMGGPDVTKLLAGTTAFMVASALAMIVSRWKTGTISPMLWMTGTLVLVFGSLTLWYHDKTFIQFKPTFIYASFSAILAFGLATERPFLQLMLGTAYPGLTGKGWRQLTINWTIFFAFMALLNEIVRRRMSYDFWVGFKLWGAIPLTLIFTFANLPMLLKHGLNSEDGTPAEDAIGEMPPEG